MNTIIPRYEYRIFGNNLNSIIDQLKSLGTFEQQREIAEIYLLSKGNTSNNIKIRNKMLDIKKLVERANNLEQWQPFNFGTFPLYKNLIKHQIFPSLDVEAPFLEREQYSLEQFMSELIVNDPDILVALTQKIRFGYQFNDCICEYAQVNINGARIDTVAVESEIAENVLIAVERLKMSELQNTNYPKILKRVLGLEINYDIHKYY
jgi:hypothetical protein